MKRRNGGSPPGGLAAGIDVGGTKIAGGLVELPSGRILERRRVPTPCAEGGPAVLDAVEAVARELSECAPGGALAALGVGLCEIVDRQGAVRSSNCVAWEGLPAVERLGRIAPCRLEADVRAAALAEARLGAGRAHPDFVYVTVGTGISACLVIGGRPYAGARGAPGTFASTPLPVPPGVPGPVPMQTLEELASGPGMAARLRQRGGSARSGHDVLAAAAAGDPEAGEVVREGARALGEALGGLINLLDPGAIILGGGLGLAGGAYHEILVESARDQVWWGGHRTVPILPAGLGGDAGWMGAALAAWLGSSGPR